MFCMVTLSMMTFRLFVPIKMFLEGQVYFKYFKTISGVNQCLIPIHTSHTGHLPSLLLGTEKFLFFLSSISLFLLTFSLYLFSLSYFHFFFFLCSLLFPFLSFPFAWFDILKRKNILSPFPLLKYHYKSNGGFFGFFFFLYCQQRMSFCVLCVGKPEAKLTHNSTPVLLSSLSTCSSSLSLSTFFSCSFSRFPSLIIWLFHKLKRRNNIYQTHTLTNQTQIHSSWFSHSTFRFFIFLYFLSFTQTSRPSISLSRFLSQNPFLFFLSLEPYFPPVFLHSITRSLFDYFISSSFSLSKKFFPSFFRISEFSFCFSLYYSLNFMSLKISFSILHPLLHSSFSPKSSERKMKEKGERFSCVIIFYFRYSTLVKTSDVAF